MSDEALGGFPRESRARLNLEELYAYAAAGDDKEALWSLLTQIGELVCDHQEYATCDRMLELVDLERLSVQLLIGFLHVFQDSREHLLAWPSFTLRVKDVLKVRVPDRNEFEELVEGLL